MSQELAPSKIAVTIDEPGGARTNFRFRRDQVGRKMEAYEGTARGLAQIMIERVDQEPAALIFSKILTGIPNTDS